MSGVTEIIPLHGETEIVNGGARGPAGPAGAPGGASFARIASVALGGHRVVRALPNDEVAYASSADPTHADLIIGITTGAANESEEISVAAGGEITEGSWTWTPGPVFCGVNGVLTQTPPASGFIRQIGTADAPDRLIIDLRPPIYL
ncbi:MAG TPA: hypothetical protein PLS69_02285 [Terricaulis sp.]|nr:hypothetical protein [Terricaulis sp.]